MIRKIIISNTFAALSLLASSVHAQPASNYIVAPDCLIKQLTSEYKVISTDKNLLLINISAKGMKELNQLKANYQNQCGGYINVTEKIKRIKHYQNADSKSYQTILKTYTLKKLSQANDEVSYEIRYEDQVNELLTHLNPDNMWKNLTAFSSYKDRYADSETGVEAAVWLEKQVVDMAKAHHRDDVTTFTIPTPDYQQKSVIAKMGEGQDPGVVISAHLDGVESYDGVAKPAADDDGSGSMTVLETMRTILASGMKFSKPIYFIWYAAEEEGLVGSQAVVEHFKVKKIPVDAVLHFDLTGYAHRNEPTMWLITDNVNARLTNYLETLINTYVKRPVKRTACGYACSDHAVWTHNGFPAAIPAESAYRDTNPNIHSSRDTMDKLSLTHMTDYAKLAIAFAVEMGMPK